MDVLYFRHQSDSRYCYSVSDHEVLLRLAVAKIQPVEKVEVVYGNQMTFGRQHEAKPMEVVYDDGTFLYYQTIISGKPPRFHYVFRIRQNGETLYFSESGLTHDYEFDLAFLSAFQMIGENRTDFVLPKPAWRGRLIYQIFPERFASHGDPKNKPYVNRDWKSHQLGGNAFLGGDLYGVIDHLDYLSSLGVGAIYLNPIHPAPSNHKYDVLDYFDVDPGFGGKDAFRKLVEEAHRRDIKIILDMVFNHTSFRHPFFEDVKKQGRNSPYYDFYMIHGNKPNPMTKNYETFSHVPWMPKLDTSNPKVQDYLISVASYWMNEFHVDGFRLDVCEGVSHECWMRLKMALQRMDPDILLIGEIWLNSESYLGPHQIDGLMNYPLLGVVSAYVLNQKDAAQIALSLQGVLVRYKEGHNECMLNLLSGHDIQRFMNLVKGNKNDVLLAYALLYFFPGMPCLYYGDEIFTPGGGDPDCRRAMDWESEEFHGHGFALFQKMGCLKRDTKALREGKLFISSEGPLLKLTRALGNEIYTLYLNHSGNEVAFPFPALLSNGLENGKLATSGFAIVKETI
ncbi:MAG: glycoside hydrolase family 13 protein [Bacilli bacterium]|nr:glycoside hydrolase family 13 protein [Bacilli bacterium]